MEIEAVRYAIYRDGVRVAVSPYFNVKGGKVFDNMSPITDRTTMRQMEDGKNGIEVKRESATLQLTKEEEAAYKRCVEMNKWEAEFDRRYARNDENWCGGMRRAPETPTAADWEVLKKINEFKHNFEFSK